MSKADESALICPNFTSPPPHGVERVPVYIVRGNRSMSNNILTASAISSPRQLLNALPYLKLLMPYPLNYTQHNTALVTP
jgi:hypothetical protein